MELTLDEVYAYLECPLKYKLKYIDKLEDEVSKNILYKRSLHKTISFFYFTLMGERLPSGKEMKDKWASIWNDASREPERLTDFLLKERPSLHGAKNYPEKIDKHNREGFEIVHNFYHYNKDNPGVPIAVDHEYRVPVGGIVLKGNFELIRERLDKTLGTRFIEIVDFKTGSDTVDAFSVNHDISLTAASFAFRNLFQTKEDRLTYHYLKTGKEIYTSRDKNEFDRFKAIIDGVAEGIAKKHFYPRQSFMCKTCGLKNICDRTKF